MEDPIEELYSIAAAIDMCRKTAPPGLAYMLELLKERIYLSASKLDNEEKAKEE